MEAVSAMQEEENQENQEMNRDLEASWPEKFNPLAPTTPIRFTNVIGDRSTFVRGDRPAPLQRRATSAPPQRPRTTNTRGQGLTSHTQTQKKTRELSKDERDEKEAKEGQIRMRKVCMYHPCKAICAKGKKVCTTDGTGE
jgi:hypothetical protein